MNNNVLLTAIKTSSDIVLAQSSSSWFGFFDKILTPISILITILGAIYALYQWYISNKIKQAEFLRQINEDFRSNETIKEAFYAVEYDVRWYDDEFHGGENGWEPKIDRLLAFLNYVCYLRSQKIITEKEFSILQYDVERVCRSYEIQSYLWNLYHFAKNQGSFLSYKNLVEYAFEKDLLPDKFENKKSKYYKKRLNF